MSSLSDLAGVEALATRVKELLWVVLDSVPAELVPWSLMLVRLLHAADTFPRGGLYDGHYATQAALRYELLWLPLAARAQSVGRPPLVPPLDVAMAWLLHRCTEPGSYPVDCQALVGTTVDPPPAQAFRFGGSHAYSQCDSPQERQAWASREAWDAAFVHGAGLPTRRTNGTAGGAKGGRDPVGLGIRGPRRRRRSGSSHSSGGGSDGEGSKASAVSHVGKRAGDAAADSSSGSSRGREPLLGQFWPPAPPGSSWDLVGRWAQPPGKVSAAAEVSAGGAAAGRGQLAGRVAGRMSDLCPLLHSLLRPAYLDPDVLAQALQRYCRFLMLQGMHPSVPLVPTTDIALMWVTHMAVPAAYRETCHRLVGRVVLPAPGVLRLEDGGPDFAETRRLYEHHFDEVYDPPLTRAVPLSALHPLLSTPLAPFLSAYDAGAPPPLPARAHNQPLRTRAAVPAAEAADATAAEAFGGALASPVLGGAGWTHSQGVGPQQGRYQHPHQQHIRCGAHALYLAYLLRRGSSRSAKSLLGLVLGQTHRRRAAVKYVANKAAGFRDFLHLPHSDCHAFWRKLRMRRVDPDAVPGSSTPNPGGQPDAGAAQQQHQRITLDELYGDAEAVAAGGTRSSGESDGEGDREEEQRQHEAVRRALVQASAMAAAAAAASAAVSESPKAAAGAPGGTAFRRVSWAEPASGAATPPRPSPSSGPSSVAGGPDPMAPPLQVGPGAAGRPPRVPASSGSGSVGAGGAAARPPAWEKPKRIMLIVPLVAAQHSTQTLHGATAGRGRHRRADAGSASSSGPSSAQEMPPGPRTERPPRNAANVSYEVADDSYSRPLSQAGVVPSEPPSPPLPATAPHATAAGASAQGAAGADAGLQAGSEGSGIQAAAAAAKVPFQMAWAAPRTNPLAPTKGPAESSRAGPAGGIREEASPEGELSPIQRRKNPDGTEEWSYNNPHYVDRLSHLGPLSPLSPLGQTPPPASERFLAAAQANEAAAAAAAAAAGTAAEGTVATQAAKSMKPTEAVADGSAAHAVTALAAADADAPVADPSSAGATLAADTAAAVSTRAGAAAGAVPAARTSGEGREGSATSVGDGGGSSGRFSRLRRDSRSYDSGPPSAGASVYMSCPASRTSLTGAEAEADGQGTGGGSDSGGRAIAAAIAAAGFTDTDNDGGRSVYGTPSAAFAATVCSPFAPDGAAGADPASNSDAVEAPAPGPAPAVGSGGGSGGSSGNIRFSGPSPSRLSRVSSATGYAPPPHPSIPPAPAGNPQAASTPHAATSAGQSRPSGLPPRPLPAGTSAASTSAAASGVPAAKQRAAGSYSMYDASSYVSGLGGVASLVGRGEEAPAFARSLRERYTAGGGSLPGAGTGGGPAASVGAWHVTRGSSGGASGNSRAGSAALGLVAGSDAADPIAATGPVPGSVRSPTSSSSGASFCSASSAAIPGGRQGLQAGGVGEGQGQGQGQGRARGAGSWFQGKPQKAAEGGRGGAAGGQQQRRWL